MEAEILQGRSLFNPVLSAHKMLLCIFQRLCTHFQDTGVLIFGGYVLSGHCNQQQISVKLKGTYFRRGTYLRGFTVAELENLSGWEDFQTWMLTFLNFNKNPSVFFSASRQVKNA